MCYEHLFCNFCSDFTGLLVNVRVCSNEGDVGGDFSASGLVYAFCRGE